MNLHPESAECLCCAHCFPPSRFNLSLFRDPDKDFLSFSLSRNPPTRCLKFVKALRGISQALQNVTLSKLHRTVASEVSHGVSRYRGTCRTRDDLRATCDRAGCKFHEFFQWR